MTHLPQSTNRLTSLAPRHFSPTRFFTLGVVALLAILVAMGSFTYTVHAAETCSTTTCVLACSARQKICSRFPRAQVPRGYVRVSFMPYGYRRVSQSKCDQMVCPSYVKDCRRWVPTQAGQ